MFGWILLAILLCYLIKKRGDLVATIARISYNKREYPKAMKLYLLANRIGPLSPRNQMLLGYVCLRCGALEDARRYLQLCSSMTKRGSADRNHIRNLLALVSWKEGNLAEAIEMLEDILESGFQTSVIFENLGIFYNLAEDKEKALAFNLKAYDYNADDLIIQDNLAESYARLGQYEKSAEIYKALVEQEPRFPEAYYGYGEVLLKLGKQQDAIAMIEKALGKPFSFLSIRPKEYAEDLLTRAKSE